MDDGGPAFPMPQAETSQGGHWQQEGMSLRDWFAGLALAALGNLNPFLPGEATALNQWPDAGALTVRRAKWAYLQADAMLAARQSTERADG